MGDEESFKVTDRRGRGEPPADVGPCTPGSPSPDAGRARADDARASGAAPSELGHLFMMFASAALINLGAVAEHEATERRVDLGQAQSAIDVLLMLRDKTRGNRTEEESRLLEDLLYDLQMRFVRAARGSAQPNAS